jgi:Double-GTPase 2
MWFVYGLAAIAYLIYVAFALPLGLLAAVAVYSCGLPGVYLFALSRVLVTRGNSLSVPPRWPKLSPGSDPAVLQYFYGPALADARHTVQLAWLLSRQFWRRGKTVIAGTFEADMVPLTAPIGIGAAIGLPVGVLVGAAVAAVCAVVHLLVVGVAAGVMQATGTVLRGADSAVLRIKNIRMVCPTCYRRVSYPAYKCPGCEKLHRDIRPGRLGILRRYCSNCGTWMPTLLLFGSSRMTAYCPYGGIKEPMEHRPGKAREIILPFFGEVGAGKTRLLLSLAQQFREWSEGEPANHDGPEGPQASPEINAEFADNSTSRALNNAARLLSPEVSTAPTPPGQMPRAHIIRLKSRHRAHLIQMFDAAGEYFRDTARTQQLRYLDKAHTFILVIDPLSVEAFWERLLPDQQAELRPVRSNIREPDLTYHHVIEEIQDMQVPVHKARLGVVLSRADLIDADGQADVETWMQTELGLGNLVRSAQLNFREVRFFRTAAIIENKELDASISPLLRWVLSGSGVDLPGDMP